MEKKGPDIYEKRFYKNTLITKAKTENLNNQTKRFGMKKKPVSKVRTWETMKFIAQSLTAYGGQRVLEFSTDLTPNNKSFERIYPNMARHQVPAVDHVILLLSRITFRNFSTDCPFNINHSSQNISKTSYYNFIYSHIRADTIGLYEDTNI